MPDERVDFDGSTTVRVYGLDAKAASISTAQFELESLVADGLRFGRAALEAWRGRHAEAFVEHANGLLWDSTAWRPRSPGPSGPPTPGPRSEERRVGKECRSRWWRVHCD